MYVCMYVCMRWAIIIDQVDPLARHNQRFEPCVCLCVCLCICVGNCGASLHAVAVARSCREYSGYVSMHEPVGPVGMTADCSRHRSRRRP